MRKAVLFVVCTLILSCAGALKYTCRMERDRATCDIPIEDFFKEVTEACEKYFRETSSSCEKYFEDVRSRVYEVKEDVNLRMEVLGTEYWQGEQVTLWVQLVNGSKPVNNQLCTLDAYDPFGGVLEEGVVMHYINGSKGMYKYSSPVDTSNMSGNYIYNVVCYTGVNKTAYYAFEFEVNQGVVGGSLDNTYASDNRWLTIAEDGISGSYSLDVVFKFRVPSGSDINLSYFLEYAWFYWRYGMRREVEDLNVYMFNFVNHSWEKIDELVGTTVDSDASKVVEDSRYIKEELLMIKFNDTSTSGDYNRGRFRIDLLKVWRIEPVAEVKSILGGGEVHVHEPDTQELIKYILTSGDFHLVSNHDYCLDNSTLVKELTYQYCLDGDCFNITRLQTINCTYGCDPNNNKCYPSPWQQFLIVVGLFVVMMVVLWLIAKL